MYHITPVARGFWSFPGTARLLVVVYAGILIFLGDVRLAMVANLVAVAGLIGMGLLSPSYLILVFWVFIYSSGHIFSFP